MSQSSKLTATVAAVAIVLAAQTASADMLTAIGAGEGEVSIVAWPGYIERGESDPGVRLGNGVREGDRLQGDGEDGRQLR